MITHALQQGSPEWHQFRLDHFGASEAAAMLGLSKKTTRSELLRVKHTGNPKEYSDWVQEHILDKGHELEALARPIVEAELGIDLYPVTCSEGKLSCSVDGMTIDNIIVWEHKQWNEALAEAVRNKTLLDEHMPQCQQILMITGAEKLIFTCSDGTAEKMVSMEVRPNPEWFERIMQGWAQFAVDLKNYVPPEIVEKPVAEAIMQLPALAIQIKGEVTVSNLPEFKAAAESFIAKINTVLVSDEDFANAEATVKFCGETEKKLEMAKASAIAQTASIDELMRTIDHIQAQLRDKRLLLDKAVKTQKEGIKTKILSDALNLWVAHCAALEVEISPIKLHLDKPDFAGAMKGLKKLSALHDAVATALANAKIEADAVAKDIRGKLAWCKENAAGMSMLFPDLQQIIYKPLDDFKLVITTRIEQHKKVEAEKLEAARAEGQAKAESAMSKPAPDPAPTPVPASPAKAVKTKPSDEDMVTALALHFRVHELKVIEWLLAMDIAGVGERMAIEFGEAAP